MILVVHFKLNTWDKASTSQAGNQVLKVASEVYLRTIFLRNFFAGLAIIPISRPAEAICSWDDFCLATIKFILHLSASLTSVSFRVNVLVLVISLLLKLVEAREFKII